MPSCERSFVGMQRLSPILASSLLGKLDRALCFSVPQFLQFEEGLLHSQADPPVSHLLGPLPMASARSQELPQPQGDWGGWSP